MVDINIHSKNIPFIEVIIFDKDGTLIEVNHYWCQMVALRAELICGRLELDKRYINNIAFEMGADLDTGRLRPEGPVGLKKREIVMQAAIDYLAHIGHKDTHDLCSEVFHDVDVISSQDLRRFVKPIGGAAELIHSASGHGCKIAIATTDRRERAGLALKYLGFDNEIDLIVGADDVKKQKPDPEQIQLILEHFKIDPSHAVMVGDALTDIRMGINAGVKASIGVLTGFANKEQLLEITPYVAEDVSKISITKRD